MRVLWWLTTYRPGLRRIYWTRPILDTTDKVMPTTGLPKNFRRFYFPVCHVKVLFGKLRVNCLKLTWFCQSSSI